MIQKLKTITISLALVLGFGVLTAAPAGAINVLPEKCPEGTQAQLCQEEDISGPVQNIISTLLFAIGVIAVIMIIIGGIRYTLSNGDASQIKSAKDTILYAVIGLIVAMLAYAIVNFVVGRF